MKVPKLPHFPKDRKRHFSFRCSTSQRPPPDLFPKGFSSSFEATGKVGLKIDLRCENKKGFKGTSIDWIEYRRQCSLSILVNGKWRGKTLRHKTSSCFTGCLCNQRRSCIYRHVPPFFPTIMNDSIIMINSDHVSNLQSLLGRNLTSSIQLTVE